MVEMVEARRAGDKIEQRYDLFSGLLDAAQEEQGREAVINEEELIGGYSFSGSFVIRKASYSPPRKYVCISSCWP
jgi:hypothetical protein